MTLTSWTPTDPQRCALRPDSSRPLRRTVPPLLCWIHVRSPSGAPTSTRILAPLPPCLHPSPPSAPRIVERLVEVPQTIEKVVVNTVERIVTVPEVRTVEVPVETRVEIVHKVRMPHCLVSHCPRSVAVCPVPAALSDFSLERGGLPPLYARPPLPYSPILPPGSDGNHQGGAGREDH